LQDPFLFKRRVGDHGPQHGDSLAILLVLVVTDRRLLPLPGLFWLNAGRAASALH
jgi:hypothetical protein